MPSFFALNIDWRRCRFNLRRVRKGPEPEFNAIRHIRIPRIRDDDIDPLVRLIFLARDANLHLTRRGGAEKQQSSERSFHGGNLTQLTPWESLYFDSGRMELRPVRELSDDPPPRPEVAG